MSNNPRLSVWLLFVTCVCSTGSWDANDVYVLAKDSDTSMNALAEQTVQRTDAALKSREITLEEQVDLLKDQIWILKGRVELIESIEDRRKKR